MEDIYLIPIRLKPLNFTIQNIYLKDIYYIYPKEYEEKIGNICIRTYKEKDSNYYKVLIKEYGEKYNSLVEPSLLTKEEKTELKTFRAIIRSKIKSGNFSKKSGRTKKQSFFDYFDEKDAKFVAMK